MIKKVKEHATYVKGEYKKHMTTALIGAFGLVIALSWQDLIKNIIDSIPKTGILLYHPYLASLYTALIVTFVGVLGIIIISRWAQPKQA